MKLWARMAICGLAGLVAGGAASIASVRQGTLDAQSAIGPWMTGRDFGTAAASSYTRAIVALRGLLALPATEARYYTASTDDAGELLRGTCRYRVSGSALPAKWWSLTLYDKAGYLVPNRAGIYSVGSASLAPTEVAAWTIIIAPEQQPGRWLPTGGAAPFELTLRTYLPDGGGKTDFTRGQLPRIVRESCA